MKKNDKQLYLRDIRRINHRVQYDFGKGDAPLRSMDAYRKWKLQNAGAGREQQGYVITCP